MFTTYLDIERQSIKQYTVEIVCLSSSHKCLICSAQERFNLEFSQPWSQKVLVSETETKY